MYSVFSQILLDSISTTVDIFVHFCNLHKRITVLKSVATQYANKNIQSREICNNQINEDVAVDGICRVLLQNLSLMGLGANIDQIFLITKLFTTKLFIIDKQAADGLINKHIRSCLIGMLSPDLSRNLLETKTNSKITGQSSSYGGPLMPLT